jgi:two-component system sensor histidine kinase CpxA
VGQLLQVTRAEGDPASLRRDPVRLDELLQQMVEDANLEARAHHCRVAYRRPEPVTVAGDPELLRRAIENVLRNAIRYSPSDTTVEVGLSKTIGRAVVSIRDQGPGVPKDALPRLFDAFYRVASDRNRTSGGIGLGLSIARRAIEIHKGSIRAHNVHPGLEVELELPAV